VKDHLDTWSWTVDMVKKVNGKTFILVVIDRFSKWVETVPSKEQSAATVIRFLTREVMQKVWNYDGRYVQTMVHS